MKCPQVRGLLPDGLAGSLDAGTLAEVNEHLETCPECRGEQGSLLALWSNLASMPAIEPSPAVDARFQTLLAGYRAGLDQALRQERPRFRWAHWLGSGWPLQPAWQLAIILLLFGSGLLAGWSVRRGGSDSDAANGTQMSELRREVVSLTEQVAVALLQQQSTLERLRGVEWASRLQQPEEATLSALLRALESDPNVNVRLAAVEALVPFARRSTVRRALLDSLSRQPSPLVQVELIDLMVDLQERESVPVLESLIQNPQLNETVRERAKRGIAELG